MPHTNRDIQGDVGKKCVHPCVSVTENVVASLGEMIFNNIFFFVKSSPIPPSISTPHVDRIRAACATDRHRKMSSVHFHKEVAVV